MEALNNPWVEDEVQEREPQLRQALDNQCDETGSPAHLVWDTQKTRQIIAIQLSKSDDKSSTCWSGDVEV